MSAVEDKATRAIAHAFESWGEAWWTDDSGDRLARVAAETLARLGMLRDPDATILDGTQ